MARAPRRPRPPAVAPRRPARPPAVAGRRPRIRLPPAPVPRAQYVPAVEAGGLLFVSGHDPAIARDAVALVRRAFGSRGDPLVLLRQAQGLAGGMPVEVELLLEVVPGRARA